MALATDRTLRLDGVTLRYRDEGAGPAVVLIHGWPLDLTIWDRTAAFLKQRFRVLRIDRRGFGASSGTPDLAADAGDIVQLLDRLGLNRAGIVAMSQGTRVAIQLAATVPDRIACLVLDATPGFGCVPGGAWQQETPLEEYRDLLAKEGLAAVRGTLAAHPLLQLVSADPAKHRELAAMIARYTGTDLEAGASNRAVATADRLRGLHVPVLILNGDADSPQRLKAGDILRQIIPGATRRVVPHAGHLACVDNPEAYNVCLDEFLTSNLPAWARSGREAL